MLLLAMLACSVPATDIPTDTSAIPTPPATSPPPDCTAGDAVFTPGLHTVELQLSSADWASMQQEAADSPEYDGPEKTEFRAQLVLDGTPAGEVALRLKGHYSLITALGHAYPLKIDTNDFTEGQTVDGLKKLNLHPAGEAQGVLREHLSYGALREFGIPTARTAFTTVTVNGEDLGLYSLVEQLGGGFFSCAFPAPHGDLYKPEEQDGNLAFKGVTIQDYPTANHKWPDETDHAPFLHLVDTINHGTLEEVGSVIDLDGVLTYLAANVAVGNFDYYATFGHNYYLYEKEPGRFTMVPWDMNLSQQGLWHPCGFGRNTADFPISHRLLDDPAIVAHYLEIVDALLQGAASAETLEARLDDALGVVGAWVSPEQENELRESITFRTLVMPDSADGLLSCPISVE